jgi:hypothetical protein
MENSSEGQSFEDLVYSESVVKERTLARLRAAARERSESELNDAQLSEEKISDQNITGLFEKIPEPYPHSVNYQRVMVTDPEEAPDIDTVEACKKLKLIMEIREKWLSAHPFPPQDLEQFVKEGGSPPRKRSSDSSAPHDSFRRRSVPPYDIFDLPLPESLVGLTYKMVGGVMFVRDGSLAVETGDGVDSDDVNASPSLFPVLSYREFVDDFNYVRFKCFALSVLLAFMLLLCVAALL